MLFPLGTSRRLHGFIPRQGYGWTECVLWIHRHVNKGFESNRIPDQRGKYSHACPKYKLHSALVGIYRPPERRSNVVILRATHTQSPQRFLRRETHLLEMGSQISASSPTLIPYPSRSWKKYNGVYGTSITPLIPLPSSTRRRSLQAVWAGRLQASVWEPGANGSAGYCKVMKGLALLRWCEWCSLGE